MIEFLSNVSRIIFALFLCSICLTLTDCTENWTAPWGFEEKTLNPTYVPPASKSSSTSNFENYYNYQSAKEEILLTKEAYPGSELFKNNNITIRLGIINNKDYSLTRPYLFDKVEDPFIIDPDSFRIDQGPDSKRLDYHFTDLSLSAEIEPNQGTIHENDNYILTLSRKRDKINLSIKQFNKSDMLYLSYNIKSNASGKYSLQPCRLFTSEYFEGKKILQSNPLFIDIIDRKPIIDSIKINPNPAKDGEIVQIHANISDPDKLDLDRCELFSSIDGLLDDSTQLNLSDPNCYYYSKDLSGLSVGNHLITLKIFDKDSQIAESTLTLTVENYIFWLIPDTYFYTVVLGCILVFIEIFIKEHLKDGLRRIKEIFS
jgi:hypothetical protein